MYFIKGREETANFHNNDIKTRMAAFVSFARQYIQGSLLGKHFLIFLS